MKIGIVTIHDDYNYGNRLQNYALYYYMKKNFGISSVSLVSKVGRKKQDETLLQIIKNTTVRFLSLFPNVLRWHLKPQAVRWANFVNWSSKIPTKVYYNNHSIPVKEGNNYDLIFAGSDQIWNYEIFEDQYDNFFLQFTEPEKRIAVSASFGVGSIPEVWKGRYAEWLNGFSLISVREDAGAQIVKELIGRDVPVLVDPVMMLSRKEWLRTAKKAKVDYKRPYVLKYFLGNNDGAIDMWAKNHEFLVYEMMNRDLTGLYSAGPGEFLSLIDNASLVYSDSFHCIAFSIIFKKPFIVSSRKGELDNITSRLDTLLKKFGFQNRWEEFLDANEYLNCDFSHVEECINNEQGKFAQYISMALEKSFDNH